MIATVGLLLLAKRSEHHVLIVSLEPISAHSEESESFVPQKSNSKTITTKQDIPHRVTPPAQVNTSGATGSVLGVFTPKEQYLNELKNFFQNQLIYPAASLASMEKGRVEVSFTIDRSGLISQVTLEKPSPFSRLNRAALELVETAHQFRAFPVSVTEEKLRLAIPIDYGM